MAWANALLRTVGIAWIVALSAACDPPAPHGHAGLFAVQGTMMANSCGAQSVPAASHLMFNAQLGYDRAQASWQLPQNGVSATGAWTDVPPSFRFTSDTFVTMRAADRRYGIAACVIHRADVIEGTLSGSLPDLAVLAAFDGGAMAFDAGSMLGNGDAGATTTFAATESIAFGVADGADCRDLIGVGQGQFLTLPCQITYAMDGAMTGVPSLLR